MRPGRECLCALLALLITCAFVAADDAGDPFLGSPVDDPFPGATADPFLAGPADEAVLPAAADDEAAARFPIRTADANEESAPDSPGPSYLFPDGPPPEPPEFTYPDGTIPVQYPLDDDAYRGLPDAYPGSPSDWYPAGQLPSPNNPPPITAPTRPVGWKTVKASLTGVFGDSRSLGITTFETRGTLEFGNMPGLFVTPHFGWHLLNGPRATDLPPQLYDVSLDISMYRPMGEKWLFNVALTPSLFTDGHNLTGDAVRIMGRGMAYYTASPTLQWAGGIVYLDREDLPVLPAFGAICTPRDDLRFELMFPKPRLAWRQWETSAEEQWVYVTGELGGQSWAVERASGADDVATYRDLRFVLGLERKQSSGSLWFVEGGYVFGREVEYESNIGGASLSSTGFLRVGGSF